MILWKVSENSPDSQCSMKGSQLRRSKIQVDVIVSVWSILYKSEFSSLKFFLHNGRAIYNVEQPGALAGRLFRKTPRSVAGACLCLDQAYGTEMGLCRNVGMWGPQLSMPAYSWVGESGQVGTKQKQFKEDTMLSQGVMCILQAFPIIKKEARAGYCGGQGSSTSLFLQGCGSRELNQGPLLHVSWEGVHFLCVLVKVWRQNSRKALIKVHSNKKNLPLP